MIHKSFPSHLSLWDQASCRLAELKKFTGPSLLDHYLPDPALFINPNNVLKSSLLLSWLCIRPVFLWRLGLPNPPSFVNRNWGAMLEAADGIRSASQNWQKMLDILKSFVSESQSNGILLNQDVISSAPAYWNGQLVHLKLFGRLSGNCMRPSSAWRC